MNRLKIALVVSGFPSETRPSHSLFNKIGAENLSKYADIYVVQLSTWKPGKKFVKQIEVENQSYKHYRVSSFSSVIITEATVCAHFKIYEKIATKKLSGVLSSIDVIHSVGAHFAGVVGSKLGKAFRKPNILQLIGSDVNMILPKVKNYKCFQNLMSWTQGVGCNTLELKQRFIDLMGEAHFMPVIYNGVDLEKFPFSDKHYTSESQIHFLYLGGLPSYKLQNGERNLKGGMTLLNAWKDNEELLNQNGCKLIFAGPDADHEIAVDFVSSLRYKDNVVLRGYLTHNEVRAYMQDSDIVLIPSMDEGMPNVAMEAGAMGKCIIGSNVGGLPEIVNSFENGILVEPGNFQALGDAMTYIVKNKSVLNDYSSRIRKVVEEKFDSRDFAPRYLELYKDVLQLPLDLDKAAI